MAVGLIEEARGWLELRRETGELDDDAARAASEELGGLFELLEDDDVLNMFDMVEPADAALAGHDPLNQQLGVADQRVESWFDAFAWASPRGTSETGHRLPQRTDHAALRSLEPGSPDAIECGESALNPGHQIFSRVEVVLSLPDLQGFSSVSGVLAASAFPALCGRLPCEKADGQVPRLLVVAVRTVLLGLSSRRGHRGTWRRSARWSPAAVEVGHHLGEGSVTPGQSVLCAPPFGGALGMYQPLGDAALFCEGVAFGRAGSM